MLMQLTESEIRKPHFKVRYRFYTEQEGGRKTLPYQGYRSDFWYDHPGGPHSLFMIYPQFEDEKGDLILDRNSSVPSQGVARMLISVEDRVPYHKEHLKLNTICYFMEGPNRVAECEVIELMF